MFRFFYDESFHEEIYILYACKIRSTADQKKKQLNSPFVL